MADDVLDADQARRMSGLYETQSERLLTDDEWAELEGLVAAYGHRLHERRMRELARQPYVLSESGNRTCYPK